MVGRNSGIVHVFIITSARSRGLAESWLGPGVGVCIQEEVVSWINYTGGIHTWPGVGLPALWLGQTSWHVQGRIQLLMVTRSALGCHRAPESDTARLAFHTAVAVPAAPRVEHSHYCFLIIIFGTGLGMS